MADSAYEYLLKGYLQTNLSEPDLGRVYMNSAAGIIDNLLLLSAERKVAFVTDSSRGQLSGVFEHLTCFLPGVLALGTKLLDDSFFTLWSTREKHEAAAAALAEACYTLYTDSPNGLSPDEVKFTIPSRKKQTNKPGPSSWSEAYVKWHIGEDKTIPSPGRDPVPRSEGPKGAEYNVRKSGNHLRPEVCDFV
jgi:mannosyl-oligosaccharide alpha-1,2-mannosidase